MSLVLLSKFLFVLLFISETLEKMTPLLKRKNATIITIIRAKRANNVLKNTLLSRYSKIGLRFII
jgi:hypothetical protein